MEFHNYNIKEIFKLFNTNKSGLSVVEAQLRLKKYGKNKLKETKKKSDLVRFLEQFKDLMILILLLASLFSFVMAIVNKDSFMDSIIIIFIVVLNAIIGFVQESKANKALDSLKKMQVSQVKVRRDSKVYVINKDDVVKGDIILLEAGDTIPADARIIWDASLKVDESVLTGESIPIVKNSNDISSVKTISEMNNIIFQGTNVVYGKCEAVVCSTGMDTEFGKIAESLNSEKKEMTPLQKKIESIGKVLSLIITVIIIIMIILGYIKGMSLSNVIMLSISLAVAAIPEGLPAVITIVLSLGMSDLAKKKAIVRNMSSVETLGSTEVICSDKTGTITQNKMEVIKIFLSNKEADISDFKSNDLFVKMMLLNNDVIKNNNNYIGDPTEIAILDYFEKGNCFDVEKIINLNKRVGELPFDSDRKMMSTINKCGNDTYLFVKGSFDSVINKCTHIYEKGKIIKLSLTKKEELIKLENIQSSNGYRLITFAFKRLSNKYTINNKLESSLIYMGFVAMIDPPRIDVAESIKICKNANIKPIMITGDGLLTARAIAKSVGILKNNSESITGTDIDKMGFEELTKNVSKYSVYARVSPMNKVSIVNAWKENGKVVAMTGDGVNDAPALKAADIGVGMGISGTEVSKAVSDIVLTDDSFSSIVTAVKEGRRIFDNIRNVLVYLLVGNIAEVFVVFICMAVGITIFSPIQLLYINLITDSIPAIALAFEKEADDVMKRKVRKNNSSFFTPFLLVKIGVSAILEIIALLLVYAVIFKIYGNEAAITTSFLTLVLSEMIYAYTCKDLKKSMICPSFFNNKILNSSMIGLGIIQLIIFLTPLKVIFNITSLNFFQVLYCFIVVFLIFVIDEVSKKIVNQKFMD